MLNSKILTNTDIKQEWFDELELLIPELDISVGMTDAHLPIKYNPYFKTNWGDFDWLRDMIGIADIRCFVTTHKQLVSDGITGHFGMYDVVDRDFKYDMYMGIPVSLDKRAKANGFQSNFAWIFVHEFLHGAEKHTGNPDRVHEMESQGRLWELLEEHRLRYQELTQKVTLLQRIIFLYAKLKTLSSYNK